MSPESVQQNLLVLTPLRLDKTHCLLKFFAEQLDIIWSCRIQDIERKRRKDNPLDRNIIQLTLALNHVTLHNYIRDVHSIEHNTPSLLARPLWQGAHLQQPQPNGFLKVSRLPSYLEKGT